MQIKKTENEVTNSIIDGLNAYGYRVWKTFAQTAPIFRDGRMIFRKRHNGLQKDGLPDLIAIGKNRILFIEVKGSSGKLRPGQKDFLLNLESVTSISGTVAYKWEDVEKLLK